MKKIVLLVAALVLLVMNGCLFVEAVEVRIRFFGNDQPPEVTLIYHNLSSDAESETRLKEDFADMISSWQSNADSLELAEKGFQLKDQQLYLEDGKLQARRLAVVTGNLAETLRESGQSAVAGELLSNDERMLVIDASEGTITATNAKVYKTGWNFVLTWPKEMREIYWIQRVPTNTDEYRQARRNRPVFVKMFETFQQEQAAGANERQ